MTTGEKFAVGVGVGVFGAIPIVVGAPLLSTGGAAALTFFGVSGTTAGTIASATVTAGVGAYAVHGISSTAGDAVGAWENNDSGRVAYDVGTLAGGLLVGTGVGRTFGEGISGRPSQAPDTWNPILLLQYEIDAGYKSDYPGGSFLGWMSSSPTPGSGAACIGLPAGDLAEHLSSLFPPNQQPGVIK
jgi:hypothetical protein